MIWKERNDHVANGTHTFINTVLPHFLIFHKAGCKYNSNKNGKSGMSVRFKFYPLSKRGIPKLLPERTDKYIWAVDSTCGSTNVHGYLRFFSPFRKNTFFFLLPSVCLFFLSTFQCGNCVFSILQKGFLHDLLI